MLKMAQDLSPEDDLIPIRRRGQDLIDRLMAGEDDPPAAP